MKAAEKIRQNPNIAAAAVLALIILVQSVYTVCVFSARQTFLNDEIWSYGLANSFYRPFLYLEPGIRIADRDKYGTALYGEWTDGGFFRDYVTVSADKRFRYDSVVSNQTLDMHPPLYFAVLHTICSFFPQQFSWSFGLSINIAAICITQVFLFLLAYELTRRRAASLAVCAVFAACPASLFVFCFIRHYALLTAFCTMFTYFTVRLTVGGFDFKRCLAPVLITALLAAFTQQLALVYAGGLTFFICLYLLCKKRIKPMLIFGLSMTAAAALYILLWPYCTSAAGVYADNHIYPYWAEVRLFFKYIFANTFGLYDPVPILIARMPIFIGALMIAAVIAAMCFVFRKDGWFKRLARAVRYTLGRILADAGIRGVAALSIIGGCTALVLVCAKVSSISVMMQYGLRYVIYAIPALIASVMYIVGFILREFVGNKKACAAVGTAAVLCVCVLSNVNGKDFYAHNPDIMPSSEVYDLFEGETVVAATARRSDMQSFPLMFMNADKAYISSCADILSDGGWIDGVRDKDKFYLAVNAVDIIWEKDMSAFIENAVFIPKDASKEDLNALNIQFIDDYIRLFKGLDFIGSASLLGYTDNNGAKMIIFEVKNK